ncbi:replication protein A 70 kDa DNA-binding subunit C-like [Cryptomeria japonica]|uniref:replication protein A 70 kDa DNA-binding subunit C-like n=1 Tax=Cryptomeria japonica TaxID=3369 RepID=UPI0027DAB007|nr:replication protein A 70 kDa DNA-binding subunit C-like [Cryptomeria japonica]
MSSSPGSGAGSEPPPTETSEMQLEIQLTSHAILSINAGDDVPSPILQLLSFEKLTDNEDDSSRYRIVLSDDTHMQLSILPPKYSDLLLSDTLKIGYVLSLASYACRNVWNTRVIIIFNLAVKFTSKRSLKFGIHMPPMQCKTFDNISPIKALNPFQNKWSIKGCVTNKRKMHHYSSPKSFGQVSSFDMIDVEGTKIRITCFGDIVEMHYHRVEVGAYYCLSKGTIREAKTKWNKLNSHIEITLDHNSILKHCDATVDGEVNASRFTPINDITYCNNNTLVDVIGVVVHVGEPSIICRKDGTTVKKRSVKINDMSSFSIDVNLWGAAWEGLGEDLKNMHATQTVVVLAVNNSHVGYFNGKVINTTVATTLNINPSTPEADSLVSRGNIPADLLPLSCVVGQLNSPYSRITIASILERMIVLSETVETTIRAIIKLQDHTGSLWATAFDKIGINLLNISAKDLYMLQYDFTTIRLKATINKAMHVDFQAECALLLVDIAQMSAAAEIQTN